MSDEIEFITVAGVRVKHWDWRERATRPDNESLMRQAETLSLRRGWNLLDTYDVLVYTGGDVDRAVELIPQITWDNTAKVADSAPPVIVPVEARDRKESKGPRLTQKGEAQTGGSLYCTAQGPAQAVRKRTTFEEL
jgi:hypothetical protein